MLVLKIPSVKQFNLVSAVIAKKTSDQKNLKIRSGCSNLALNYKKSKMI